MSAVEPGRPDPDALLAAVAEAERGALKIFLGASPGVGKTYKMLEAAREARRAGTDVVVAVVESHGRTETEALVEGLERIPLARLEYRGNHFPEMDLDAVLARAPQVALVDELAHRNIPGSRHPRRYQDIEELLDAGIDVWTTLNVQHLETLHDAVARITGVRMQETVPDSLLASARDVVLVDVTPRELIERLEQGKVYVPEQARAALAGFFSPSNLAALRDLTLQAVAERVDRDVRDAMRREGVAGPWPVRTRIVVAIDGLADGEELVRRARRLADRQRAPWHAVYVDAGDHDPARQLAAQQALLFAERMGATTAVLRGHDPAAEILAFARAQNATTLVLGRSRRRWLAGRLGRTLSQRLLRTAQEFELVFVAMPVGERSDRAGSAARTAPRHYVFALAVVAACVGLGLVIEAFLPLANVSLVFLGGVMLVGLRTALRPALFTAVVGALAYNFFLTEPRYSFAVHDASELLTVLFFLFAGLVGGHLAGRLRQQLLALRTTNDQARVLATLSRRLAGAPDLAAIEREVVTVLAEQQQLPVMLLEVSGADGLLVPGASSAVLPALGTAEMAAAQWAREHLLPAGRGTDTLPAIPWRFLPLLDEGRLLAIIGVRFGDVAVSAERLSTIDALLGVAVLALARVRLVASLEMARVEGETERLRAALLSSISHDLRTPLSSMIGAASSLQTLDAQLSESDRAELLDLIQGEGQRLDRYIQNLLDMTRLGHGTLKLERDWIGVDDIVGAALRRTREGLRNARVTTRIAPDLPLLHVHPALLEQALVNVLENAARFSPPAGEVLIEARRDGDQLELRVSDQGPGIPAADRARVFDMFFTGGAGDRGSHGSGLGLAICRGMVGAHGGRIEAREGPGGRGTTIVVHLPVETVAQTAP